MSSQATNGTDAIQANSAGGDLRGQVEEAGNILAESFSALLGTLPGRLSGPQALANQLGITVVTASRLLRAIDQKDPIAVAEQIPGTVPLRKIIASALKNGASKERGKKAGKAVDLFEELIRKNAGHRSSLNAMLTDWLPQSRREFEIRRRQAAFKAISELKGISCELDLATIVLNPSEKEGHLDLLSLQGIFGVDRIRPDSIAQFGTMRTQAKSKQGKLETKNLPSPRTLDDEPAYDGLHSVRLDEFCSSTPAPIETQQFGNDIQYTLGQTGFGPDSSVDLVMAELNRSELKHANPIDPAACPYFFQIPAAPARAMVFDLLIHEDLYQHGEPHMMVYDTSTRGPARAGAPEREVDRVRVTEEIEVLGMRPSNRRFSGFPRYLELLDHALGKLGWNPDAFRAYRVHMNYPLHATQVSMVIRPASDGGE